MTKIYTLKGLDCPHCAAEIEEEVCKLKGITSSNVNLIKQTLTVEVAENYSGNIFNDIEKVVHTHEPDVEVIENVKKSSHSHSNIKIFTLKGLNCPHCAGEIEEEVGKLSGVTSSNVNLIKQTLIVEIAENYSGNIFNDIEKVVHTHEPDVEVIENVKKSSHSHSNIKTFSLKGLDCPHCAGEIEEEVGKLRGVTSSNVNLIKQTLNVEIAENYSGNIFNDIEKIVHTHEPDVEVIEGEINVVEPAAKSEKQKSVKKEKSSDNSTIIRFAVGAVLFVIGFAMSHFTNISLYIQLPILIAAYIILGGDVVLKAVRNITKGRVFDENFLMTISTVGAFIIGDYSEAVAVMLFYQVGEFFQSLAVKKSRKSITDLMDIRPDSANVKRNGDLVTVSPDEVEIGEVIVVKPGEKIPLDGVVIDGESMLDTKALTGESVPRKAKKGDTALSGCINETGVLSIKVTKAFEESTASKIIDLVENAAARKAPTENFITTFSRYYTPIVVILAALLAVVPPLVLGGGWADWVHRGFVFLVISCPCALVISIPLTFFGGIGAASKKGVLVKGSNYLEALNAVETIVFDKTGTLTKGVFKVTDTSTAKGFTKEQLIEYGAKAECMSNHPIARSIVQGYGKKIDKASVKNYAEISGHGISAEVDGHKVLAGNEKLMTKNNIKFEKCGKAGTTVYVAVDGKFAGYMLISDEIKEDSKTAISGLKEIGVNKTVMLTGDNKEIAKAVADTLKLDEYFGELLPDQKVEMLEKLDSEKSENGKLAFVGDGINDAPVLARADVGIAMGGLGSDAAIEAADVVLMTDEPSKLIDAISVAKYTKKIVTQNIVIVLIVKILFLILGAFGVAGMWEAVFGDVGVMIIAVINAMRILKK